MSPEEPRKPEPITIPRKPKEFTVPENAGNVKMAILRHIYPNTPRKQLRKLLKNKKFMKELDIKAKPKE